MKTATCLALLVSLGLLAACDSKPFAGAYVYPNDRYLEENVARWNSMINTINAWSDSPLADEFHAAIESGDDLSKFRFRLNLAHDSAVKRRVDAERLTHRKEADDLHQHLLTSLQSTADMFSIMVNLADLPIGYTAEQAASLLTRLEHATERMDTDLQILSDAQDSFAKSESIRLTTRDHARP